jgi:nickel-dependent lactate racemase
MVDCWLPYGETEVYVSVEMEQLLGIAEPNNINAEKPSSEILSKAFAEPIGKKLEELLTKQTTVAIAVDNYANPNAVVLTLRELVRNLVDLIIPSDRLTIILGNSENLRNRSKLRAAIENSSDLKNITLIDHNHNTSTLVDVGTTHRGTPVKVNSHYHAASLKIAVGETRVDQYMGFSGAHSAVIPGLASAETVIENRKHYIDGEISPSVIELNPVKEDIIEAVNSTGIDFAVNLVTNTEGRIVAAYTGGFEETWGRAINSLSGHYEATVEENADITLVSAGGLPHDQSLYTASLALKTASTVTKKNGTIILLAECGSGFGAEAFTQLAKVTEKNEFKRRYMYGAEALQEVKQVQKNQRMILVSALPVYLVESIGMESARTANEAYKRAVQSRRGRRTTVIPKGLTTVISKV